jgi:hypothetical protein
MRIHLLGARAALLAFALGISALPASAQNNNVAFNRRLTLSDPAKANVQSAESAVRPAGATQTAPGTRTPVVQVPGTQNGVRVAASHGAVRQEVMAGDSPHGAGVLQPVPVRSVRAAESAPAPIAVPVATRSPAIRTAAGQIIETGPIAPPSRVPVVSARVVEASRSGAAGTTLVHSGRIYADEPQPLGEAMGGVPMGGGDCGDPACDRCNDCRG